SQLTLNLTFSPTSITSYSGDMLITTDDPVNPTLTVQLTGIGQPVANDDPVLPAVTELKGNWPNPFNPSTSISFSVKEASPVIIEVYNLKGQLVRTLIKESKAAGNHRIVFDGRDNAGQPLASGVYFYKMQAGKYSATRKMILMK
ncbi:MAG TPA: FlgD immunoglobulin-like domain containing protein, partial [Candidatus Syntrophosphaera sp.]|nr:FlgD immunoglobulin-like domain containing protein [Candidatus Syntrophosphaera sp.]